MVFCGVFAVGMETSLGGHASSYGVIHEGNHLCIVGGGGPGFARLPNWLVFFDL